MTWWADTTSTRATLYYALAYLGAIFVPLNPRFSADEFRAVLDIADPAGGRPIDDRHEATSPSDELLAEPAPSMLDLPAVHETDPDVIFFTSGTTGQPKGCVLSHRSNRLRTQRPWARAPIGTVMTMFPQFHWGGWSFCHGAWYSGHEYRAGRRGQHRGGPRPWRGAQGGQASTASRPCGADLRGGPEPATTCARSGRPIPGTSSTPTELLTSLIAETFPGTTTWIGYGATEAGGLCHAVARGHLPQGRIRRVAAARGARANRGRRVVGEEPPGVPGLFPQPGGDGRGGGRRVVSDRRSGRA